MIYFHYFLFLGVLLRERVLHKGNITGSVFIKIVTFIVDHRRLKMLIEMNLFIVKSICFEKINPTRVYPRKVPDRFIYASYLFCR